MTERLIELFTTAELFRFPDSSFGFIEPGGKKDDQGRTTPRSLRHLPFKNENDVIDFDNVANALARINQVKNLPVDKERSLIRMFQAILEKERQRKARESDGQATNDRLREDLPDFLKEAKVDMEAGVIRNVFIAKTKSAQRDYDHKALEGIEREAEGISVYSNHITEKEARENGGVRDVGELIGKLINVKKVGARVHADWELLDVQTVKEKAFAWAKLGARGLGFSIDATGFERVMASSANGRERITDITKLASVDVVSRKGMNPYGTLYEHDPENGSDDPINNHQTLKEDEEMDKIQELEAKIAELVASLKESDDERTTLKEEKAKAEAQIKLQEALEMRRTEINKKFEEAKVEASSQVVDDLALYENADARKRAVGREIELIRRLSESEKKTNADGGDISIKESDAKVNKEVSKKAFEAALFA